MRWLYVVAAASLVVHACGAGAAQANSGSTSSVDPRAQQAAEQAVGDAAAPVDLLAMRASTGQVLAYVSRGGGLLSDDALVGKYPTGSTFKVITAADLIAHGRTPASPAACPASITVDGKTLANIDNQAHPIVTLEQAFAQSCNTAFAALGAQLPGTSFRATAAQFGLGATPRLDRPAFGGTVAEPTTAFDRATVASVGGSTLVSPLALATVAATVATGTLHIAHLGKAGADKTRPRQPNRSVIVGLRSMMATAVTSGTAAGQGLPADTHAKTGTAEFVDAPPPRTVYSWLIGYRGDIAFAVLVIGGPQNGPVAGPVAASFLNTIG